MPTSNRRAICFRGRRLTDKIFVYGQLVVFGNQAYIFESQDIKHEIDTTTRGQLIGIRDKNGVEVYEGDLVIATDNGGQYDIFIVVYRGCGFIGKHYSSENYIDLMTHDLDVVGAYYSSELERDLQDIKKKIDMLTGDN